MMFVLTALSMALAGTPAVQTGQDPYTYSPVSGGGFGWRHASVKREGGAVTAEVFTYYDAPEGPEKYRWRFQTVRFDCAAKNYTTVEGKYLDLSGKPVLPVSAGMTWPVEEGSIENIVFQVLCNRANFTDGKVAPDRAAAMRALAG